METKILEFANTQGLWAVLFVVLLFYVLKVQEKRDKRSEERENQLMVALEQAQQNNQQFAVSLNRLSGDVEDIKNTLKGRAS